MASGHNYFKKKYVRTSDIRLNARSMKYCNMDGMVCRRGRGGEGGGRQEVGGIAFFGPHPMNQKMIFFFKAILGLDELCLMGVSIVSGRGFHLTFKKILKRRRKRKLECQKKHQKNEPKL